MLDKVDEHSAGLFNVVIASCLSISICAEKKCLLQEDRRETWQK